MRHTLFAFFDNPRQAMNAARRLRKSGDVTDTQIRMPSPVHALSPDKETSWIPVYAMAGALLGAVSGFLLVTLTSLSFPIPTGGMPILPWGPVGIVTYETTMLGAILATLAGFLIESGLPKFRSIAYDEFSSGQGLSLTVSCLSENQLESARQILGEAGAIRIERHDLSQ